LDPRAIVVVLTVRAPLWIVLDEKVAVPLTLSAPEMLTLDEKVELPPWDDIYVTTNELAVVVPDALLKVRAELPDATPALL
jgi:hypothetical protein